MYLVTNQYPKATAIRSFSDWHSSMYPPLNGKCCLLQVNMLLAEKHMLCTPSLLQCSEAGRAGELGSRVRGPEKRPSDTDFLAGEGVVCLFVYMPPMAESDGSPVSDPTLAIPASAGLPGAFSSIPTLLSICGLCQSIVQHET